ncbi:left-handed beta-roll domain-containing protein [Bartonella taylorii]|nr:left-handed beta-roll domain-containing protein [Bartonella taylorii]
MATGEESIAIGHRAKADGEESIAFGACGSESVADVVCWRYQL